MFLFFFSSRRRHTRSDRDWSSDVCSSDLWSSHPSSQQKSPALHRADRMRPHLSDYSPPRPRWLVSLQCRFGLSLPLKDDPSVSGVDDDRVPGGEVPPQQLIG